VGGWGIGGGGRFVIIAIIVTSLDYVHANAQTVVCVRLSSSQSVKLKHVGHAR